jgi:hypothetical protein
MTAALGPFDGPEGYVGRHAPDHIDADTRTLLVAMYLANRDGDTDTSDAMCHQARQRLYRRGADVAMAMRAINRAMPEIRKQAKALLAELDEMTTVEADRG